MKELIGQLQPPISCNQRIENGQLDGQLKVEPNEVEQRIIEALVSQNVENRYFFAMSGYDRKRCPSAS